jgi:hypothetical protein
MSPAADGVNRAGLPRPALFVIDNDPGVVSALTEDLGRRFGQDFTIVSATTADAGWPHWSGWPPTACRWRC